MGLADELSDAKRRGFTHNFAWHEGQLRCSEHGEFVTGENATIVDSIPVDMGTDPADDATLYLIEAADGVKGYMILADSFHVDPEKAAFIDRLLGRQ